MNKMCSAVNKMCRTLKFIAFWSLLNGCTHETYYAHIWCYPTGPISFTVISHDYDNDLDVEISYAHKPDRECDFIKFQNVTIEVK